MSDEGSAQPVAAQPTAEATGTAGNNTVGNKATDAPGPAAAETKAEGPNTTGEGAEKEAAEPAKEGETAKEVEGENSYSSAPAPGRILDGCNNLLTIAST